MIARGRIRQGGMNKTEAAYAAHLDQRKAIGEVLWWLYESWNLRLADKTWYKPDFAVMLANGEIEAHEVKGFWEDDARVKIKVAAEIYPFRFIGVQRDGKEWKYEIFERAIQQQVDVAPAATVKRLPRQAKTFPGVQAQSSAPRRDGRMAEINGVAVPVSEALKKLREGGYR